MLWWAQKVNLQAWLSFGVWIIPIQMKSNRKYSFWTIQNCIVQNSKIIGFIVLEGLFLNDVMLI